MPKSLDLDVESPDQVASILRDAAEKFYESASELASAWTDRNAGKCWEHIARKLEQCADRIEKDSRCQA